MDLLWRSTQNTSIHFFHEIQNSWFWALSHVYVYRIAYVSYRQGPILKRIVSAADHIVPVCFISVCVYTSRWISAYKLLQAWSHEAVYQL